MNKHQTFLIASGLAWCGFGVWLWLFPETINGVGLSVEGATGTIEVRAVYGGLELGLGGFLLWASRHPSRTRTGLVAALFSVAGIGMGRATGIAMEGFEASDAMWLFLGIEMTATAMTGVLLCSHDTPSPNEEAHQAKQPM
jgi:hypothetical protein